MNIKRLFSCILSLLCLTNVVVGAESPSEDSDIPHITLEQIVVTASHFPEPTESIPNTVKVITLESVEKELPVDIAAVLRQIPGLFVMQPGSRGAIGSVSMRGSDDNLTLIMIDGVRMNDPTDARGGTVDLSSLDPSMIERIEIIYGPLSSIYGSDSVAGVINIITREPLSHRAIEVAGSAGLKGYYTGRMVISGTVAETVGYSLNASLDDNGTPVDGDSFRGYNTLGKITARFSEHSQLLAHFRYATSDSESFPDDSGGQKWAIIPDQESRETQDVSSGIQLNQQITSKWDVSLVGTYYTKKTTIDSPGIAPGVRDPVGIPASDTDTDLSRLNLSLKNLLALSNGTEFAFGCDYQEERADSVSTLYMYDMSIPTDYSMNRTQTSPYIELHLLPIKSLRLNGGLRCDTGDDFDTQYSPSFGLIWNSKATHTVGRLSWAKGFKLPSFYALAHPIVGNADLKPETSENVSLGLEQTIGNNFGSLNCTLFYTTYSHSIEFDEGPPPRMVNLSEVVARGVEGIFSCQIASKIESSLFATYTKTENINSDITLLYRPEWQGGLSIDWHYTDRISARASTHYVGSYYGSSIPTGQISLGNYFLVNMEATWSFRESIQLAFALDNVLNTAYETTPGFTGPGIRPRMLLRWHL